jgi:KUP system potassium uptake protein
MVARTPSGASERAASSSVPAPAGHPHDAPPAGGAGHAHRRLAPLTLAALGIVYGDIGTSPLYAFRETLHEGGGLLVDRATVLGVASLVLWSLVVIIAIKYLTFVLRADAKGEGGILALTSLLDPRRNGRPRTGLILLGVFGTALLYGDGAITPAISVLAAVEGIEVVTDAMAPAVIPLAIGILIGLFAVQHRGTASIGKVFGRVMLVWFAVLAIMGTTSIIASPEVLASVDPRYAIAFLAGNGLPGFLSLGAVFLVVTGGEALYADMGHFGRKPIAVGWFGVVMPALALNYLGQAALLLRDPEAIRNPFYLMAPDWGLVPLVVLATAATVIASQALISGVFSLSVQAVQLNYLPRVQILHTSEEERGQVYLPAMNVALLVACIALVLGFRSSGNLAAAYGVAVTATMIVTTILFTRVAIDRFGWNPWLVYPVAVAFGAIDLAFLIANLFKIADGGWFPLALGAVMFVLMSTWHTGRRLLAARLSADGRSLDQFLDDLDPDPIRRLPGTGVMLYSRRGVVPPAMLTTLRHFDALHERVIILTVEMDDRPHVTPADRLDRQDLGHGFEAWTVRYGFRDRISVPETLAATADAPGGVDPLHVSYFLGRESIVATAAPGMAIWRERLFGLLLRNATDAASFFDLPPDQTTTVGQTIEI